MLCSPTNPTEKRQSSQSKKRPESFHCWVGSLVLTEFGYSGGGDLRFSFSCFCSSEAFSFDIHLNKSKWRSGSLSIKWSIALCVVDVEESSRKFGRTFLHMSFCMAVWCFHFFYFFLWACSTFHSYTHLPFIWYVMVVTMIMIIVSSAKWSNNKKLPF